MTAADLGEGGGGSVPAFSRAHLVLFSVIETEADISNEREVWGRKMRHDERQWFSAETFTAAAL